MAALLSCECVEALTPFDRLTQIYAAVFALAGDDSLPSVDCVAAKPPWDRLDDIYCAALAWSGDATLPSCACVAGLSVSDRLTAIYEAFFAKADDAELPSVVCVDGLSLLEKLTAIYEAILTLQFDADAEAFFLRAGISDTTQKDAVNDLVVTLKSENLWEECLAIYPFVGGDATAHSKNLKADQYNITWNGTVTHNANGVTGNGTNGYGECAGLTGTVHGHHCGLSVYIRVADSTSAFGRMMGHVNGATTVLYLLDRVNAGGFESERGFLGAVANAMISSSVPPRTGLWSVNRTANDAAALYLNGSSLVTNSSADASTPNALNVFLLALNANGSAGSFTTANVALAAVHSGFTETQAAAFYTAVQAFQTTLGRNV